MTDEKYTPELAEEILNEISNGSSLRKCCRDRKLPKSTVHLWLTTSYAGQYARACEARTEILVDEIIDIADDSEKDRLEDGKVDLENINRSRLRIDARKWYACKMLPKKYGDQLTVDASLTHQWAEAEKAAKKRFEESGAKDVVAGVKAKSDDVPVS